MRCVHVFVYVYVSLFFLSLFSAFAYPHTLPPSSSPPNTSIHARTQFTGTDKSEIARNSVLTSGFEHHWKRKWLGDDYTKSNLVDANTQDCSNISDIRTSFRHSNLMRELHYVALRANEAGDEAKSVGEAKSAPAAKVAAAEELEKNADSIAASGSSTVRFVHLAGHSIPMAESLFRGVNGTAVLAGRIAMRDDVERESESAQDLARVWQVQKKAVEAVGEAHRRASLNVSEKAGGAGVADAEGHKELSLGFGSSATGLEGVTPAQVSKFVSKRHRCAVMQ